MRELRWGEVPNVRYLGGLRCAGGVTRFGRIARGPRRERFDAAAWQAAQAWGLRTIIDLRCAYETGHQDGDPEVPTPTGLTVVSAPTEDHDHLEFRQACFPILDSPAYWTHNLRILPELVHTTLQAITDARPGVLIHCSAGRDRTGLVTALLLGNGGVSPADIADDWQLSVHAMAGVPAHAPTHDDQATWDPGQVNQWTTRLRPLVEDFARDTPRHLDTVGISPAIRQRLHGLLLDESPLVERGA